VLRRVRDPLVVSEAWRAHGVAAPLVRLDAPDASDARAAWMLKPIASGGGRGVTRWPATVRVPARVPRCHYLQTFVEGTPASVAFVAARGRAVPLALTRQLVGDPRFGASGYRYCGNILAPATDPQFARGTAMAESAARLAQVAAEAFGLVGLNGIDAVARDGVLHPIEINPRWSASMELVERAHGVPLFALHARACEDGSLPEAGPLGGLLGRLPQHGAESLHGCPALGKAIVFARRSVTLGDTRGWLADPDVRDVPHPGERIPAGHAVCTVLASGADAAACYAALVARAAAVYDDMSRWEREAA
jgi:predicted ATP-grasp superfamily ATP-dependent carboligase